MPYHDLFLLVLLAGLLLWLVAIVDLIQATDMDTTARLILAAALILFAPVGVLLWLIVRKGRVGMMLATVLLVGTFAIFAGIFNAWNFGGPFATQHSVQMETIGGGASGQLGQP